MHSLILNPLYFSILLPLLQPRIYLEKLSPKLVGEGLHELVCTYFEVHEKDHVVFNFVFHKKVPLLVRSFLVTLFLDLSYELLVHPQPPIQNLLLNLSE